MANRFIDPFPQWIDADGEPLVGGSLTFYLTGGTTPATIYSNQALSVSTTNPAVLDAAGRAPAEIWLDPNVIYRCILKDASGTTIEDYDPVIDPAANLTAAFRIYNGDPNGNVAGNAGVIGGAGASAIFDVTSSVLWICTTTGSASTAVWTQIGATFAGAVSFTSTITPSSISGATADYAPTGFSTCSIVRQDSSGTITYSGWAGGSNGRRFTYHNVSNHIHVFLPQDSGSSAANRFILTDKLFVYPYQSVSFLYDSTSARWRQDGAFYILPAVIPGGRLTLVTAQPVLTSLDVTAITTVFYTSYLHSIIDLLNDNGAWYTIEFSEMSQTLADATKSPAAAAVSSVYDMFVWSDAGTIRCTRGPAWTSATSRGTGAGTSELVRVNGRLANAVAITNGPGVNRGRYVGTIATDGTGANGQMNMRLEPSAAAGGSNNRLDVWNMYNRIDVAAIIRDSTDSWAYSTATFRSLNNSTSNRCTYVQGQSDDRVRASLTVGATHSASGRPRIGIGIDSTSLIAGSLTSLSLLNSGAVSGTLNSNYAGRPGIGSHFIQALELTEGGATGTFYGDNADAANFQSGMIVELRM